MSLGQCALDRGQALRGGRASGSNAAKASSKAMVCVFLCLWRRTDTVCVSALRAPDAIRTGISFSGCSRTMYPIFSLRRSVSTRIPAAPRAMRYDDFLARLLLLSEASPAAAASGLTARAAPSGKLAWGLLSGCLSKPEHHKRSCVMRGGSDTIPSM